VKLGILKDEVPERKYAIKILRPGQEKLVSKEVSMLRLISDFTVEQGLSVVRMHEFLDEVPYQRKNGEMKKVTALVLEYVDGCELFQIIAKTGPLGMDASRILYNQLLNSLEYIHNKEVVHRDLKPQNLLVDLNGALRLTDFGFSTLLMGEQGRGWLKSFGGTEGYMAPEMQRKEDYRGQRSDIFASGVILFYMTTGLRPFFYAKPSDQWYNLLITGKTDLFWQCHQKKLQEKIVLTPSFQALVESVLCDEPASRPRIPDIREKPWMLETGSTTPEEVKKDLQNRINVIKVRKEAEKAEKQAAAQRRAQAKLPPHLGLRLNPGPGGPAPPATKGMAPTQKRIVPEEVIETIGFSDRRIDFIDEEDVRLTDHFCSLPIKEATEVLVECIMLKKTEFAISQNSYKVSSTILFRL
jgi:serine/threonine protein kinase